jgi:hypothetical protein
LSGKDLSARSCCPSLDVNEATAYAARHDEHHQGSDRLSRGIRRDRDQHHRDRGRLLVSRRAQDRSERGVGVMSPETVAAAVVKSARQHGGKTPNVDVALAALHQAASDHRATLTPHAVAVERAGDAVKRLDAYIGSMRGTGALVQQGIQTETTEGGCGFMTYKVALARLRFALIPLLIGGGQPSVGQSLFAQVFR